MLLPATRLSAAQRWFSVVVAFAFLVVGASGCAKTAERKAVVVVVPGDADVVAEFADLHGAVDGARLAGRLGLFDVDGAALSESSLEAAGLGAPVAIARRPNGSLVVSARLHNELAFQGALAMVLKERGARLVRLLGRVDVVEATKAPKKRGPAGDAEDSPLLIRAGDGVVVVVLGSVDPLAEAALVEALVMGGAPSSSLMPSAPSSEASEASAPSESTGLGRIRVRPPATGPLAGLFAGDLVGTLNVAGDAPSLHLVGRPGAGGMPWVSALRSTSPTFACAAEEGAALVLHLPPIAGLADVEGVDGVIGRGGLADPDSFDGRLVVAIHPPAPSTPAGEDLATMASLVVVGHPRPEAVDGLKASLAEAGDALESRTVGSRTVHRVVDPTRPWRGLHLVADADVFALGVGAPVPVDRVAVGSVCPPSPGRLLTLHGAPALAVLGRLDPRLGLAARLGSLIGVHVPAVDGLKAVDTLAVDAIPQGSDVAVTISLALH